MTFSVKIVSLVFLALISSSQSLKMDDCLEINEPALCYLCDSQEDPYCGDPFRYSHYYNSKDVYLTECQGCCIKIVHPSYEGAPRRILRSCTDNLPKLNYTLEESCYSGSEEDRKICICDKELCNKATGIRIPNVLLITIGVFLYTKNFVNEE